MNRFILCWDVETTGLNAKEDSIIQLAAVRFNKITGEFIDGKKWYIKPAHAYEISPAAQAVHGLSKEFIEANGVYFKDVAPEFFAMMEDADLLTYNGNSFDIKFLYEECKRWEIEFPIVDKRCYDAFAMECRLNPRNLSAVYKKYIGEDLDGAHDALNDVIATCKVFLAQMERNGYTYEVIDEWNENNLLTPDGTIRNTAGPGEEMRIVFAVGKYKDSEFMDITRKDPSYIKWYMDNLATAHTKKILSRYYAKHR